MLNGRTGGKSDRVVFRSTESRGCSLTCVVSEVIRQTHKTVVGLSSSCRTMSVTNGGSPVSCFGVLIKVGGSQTRVVGVNNSTLKTDLKFTPPLGVQNLVSLLTPHLSTRPHPRFTGRETFWSVPFHLEQLVSVKDGLPRGTRTSGPCTVVRLTSSKLCFDRLVRSMTLGKRVPGRWELGDIVV